MGIGFFEPDFDAGVKSRGREYFRRRKVRVLQSAPYRIVATVQGHDPEPYRVSVECKTEFEDPNYECTCPFFRENDGLPCKHIWAALLQAKADKVLPHPDEPDDYLDDVYDVDDNEDDEETIEVMKINSLNPHKKTATEKTEDPAAWKAKLARISQTMLSAQEVTPPGETWSPNRRVLYIVDVATTLEGRGLTVELSSQMMKRDGQWERPKQLKVRREQIASLPDADDRQIFQMLLGAPRRDWSYYSYYDHETTRRFVVPEPAFETTFKLMCDTGRCFLRMGKDEHLDPLSWDDGPPWEFWLEIKASPGGRYQVLEGSFRRPVAAAGQLAASDNGHAAAEPADAPHDAPPGAPDEQSVPATPYERLEVSATDMVLRGGLIFLKGRVARLDDGDAFDILAALRQGLKLSVPLDQRDDLLRTLFSLPRLPKIDLPQDVHLQEVRPTPKPRLTVKRPKVSYDDCLVGVLWFDYDGQIVEGSQPAQAVVSEDGKRVLYRNPHAEAVAAARLIQVGFRQTNSYGYTPEQSLRLPASKLAKVVSELTAEGWHVQADGKIYRQAGEFQVQVTSGIDWFEMHGTVSFGDNQSAALPRLLQALRRGEKTVTLDDGTLGLLPDEWLKRYAPLASIGEEETDHLRFSKRQVGFLDALLASMPEATFDIGFTKARDQLMKFEGVKPLDPPNTFTGELRPYQRDGLGWMQFLRDFDFGGCLADDMGLGKTVQILALLESRRRERLESKSKNGTNGTAAGAMSLVVVPRSLVFNWLEEAKRFTPDLRVLDHTHAARQKGADHFGDHDLILTTYGTLRRDAAYFKDVKFDYVILDEAQAVKNANSESAKAVRLLRADHRLALSGTPVQNHLGELWSLFEFLNPGMMGAASIFKSTGAGSATVDNDARQMLAKAVRPFILRRTKEQVARELPAKLEQTVYCEMEPAQRKLYDELKEHYRTSLLDRIARDGINKSKIQVLEALLRLRQAACHPGLIDKAKRGHSSAKLDVLLSQLSDVLKEDHKVLVFSQFTTLLSIVRDRLDKEGTVYEYLDGKTRDRQARVERFQNDPNCKLFLISLKAGGLGLNLTAAEYVFLLDPWWNPAVEAQAIDRAHRIGQLRQVFAYRLIAKDTVEEKVLQLQQTKKNLADAIISADNSLIRTLGREDLELLLS